MKYTVLSWTGACPDLNDREFDPANEDFCALEAAKIDRYVWDPQGYCPEARAYAARRGEDLLVLMCAKEENIIAQETRIGGDVYRDSCLEFFINPCPSHGEIYLNIEVNAAGVAHIGIGDGRHGRRVLQALPQGMEITHSCHNGAWWAVSYVIPGSFVREVFGCGMEHVMRGNFYTCDESIHPHFGTWSPVEAAQPDFHRPECFGELVMED